MTTVHASAIVEQGATLGANVSIGPFSLIGARARLGDGVNLASHVIVLGETDIGAGTIVHPHVVLGGGPQFRVDDGAGARLANVPNWLIREHVTMNGGSQKGGGLTQVGSNGYFMAY